METPPEVELKLVTLPSGTRLKPKGNGDTAEKVPVSTSVNGVRNAVEAERQWRRTIRSKRRRAKITSPTGDAPKGNGDPSTAFVPVIPIEVGREQPKPIQIPSRLGALSLAVGVGMFAKQKANALSSTGPTILNK